MGRGLSGCGMSCWPAQVVTVATLYSRAAKRRRDAARCRLCIPTQAGPPFRSTSASDCEPCRPGLRRSRPPLRVVFGRGAGSRPALLPNDPFWPGSGCELSPAGHRALGRSDRAGTKRGALGFPLLVGHQRSQAGPRDAVCWLAATARLAGSAISVSRSAAAHLRTLDFPWARKEHW